MNDDVHRVATREAARSDEAALADVLARAFEDDPIQEWLIPDETHRYKRLVPFFKGEIRTIMQKGRVVTTADRAGAALWAPPGKWKIDPLQLALVAPLAVVAFRDRLVPGMRFLTKMEKAHPVEPHWYLAVLGTHPWRQGRGVGGALITAVTDRCDRDGTPAYLESSKEANVPYYERFGFRVTGEVNVPGSPSVWTMWRDPQ